MQDKANRKRQHEKQKCFFPWFIAIQMQIQISWERSPKVIVGKIQFITTSFLIWMMKKVKEKKEKKMMLGWRRRGGLKESNGEVDKDEGEDDEGTLMDSNLLFLKCSPVTGSKLQSFFPPLMGNHSALETSFLSFTSWSSTYVGKIP